MIDLSEVMINHLGRNPVKGGIPARERNRIDSTSKSIGDVAFTAVNWLELVIFQSHNKIKMGVTTIQ